MDYTRRRQRCFRIRKDKKKIWQKKKNLQYRALGKNIQGGEGKIRIQPCKGCYRNKGEEELIQCSFTRKFNSNRRVIRKNWIKKASESPKIYEIELCPEILSWKE